jgi:hypothetical protein
MSSSRRNLPAPFKQTGQSTGRRQWRRMQIHQKERKRRCLPRCPTCTLGDGGGNLRGAGFLNRNNGSGGSICNIRGSSCDSFIRNRAATFSIQLLKSSSHSSDPALYPMAMEAKAEHFTAITPMTSTSPRRPNQPYHYREQRIPRQNMLNAPNSYGK